MARPLVRAALALGAGLAVVLAAGPAAALSPEARMRLAQAAFGHPEAASEVAGWLAVGDHGLPPAPALARRLRGWAADAGHVEAMIAHAVDLGEGRLGPADPAAARLWLEAAEARADLRMRRRAARAWARLGAELRAIAALRALAEVGDLRAASDLALAHLRRGEPERAAPWLDRLRAAPSPTWCAWVARVYERGTGKLAPDPVAAAAWYAHAAARGHRAALARPRGRSMTPAKGGAA